MLDNLILAYRAQFYDWDFSKWKELCKKNIILVVGFGVLMLMIAISIVVFVKLKYSLPMLIILLCEGAASILLDRYAVKRYRQFLLNKQCHLEEIVSFLKTILPEKNLFGVEYVEELTTRLTISIELKTPFKDSLTRLSNFAKAIIFPVITYVAGIYSVNLGQLGFETVTNWAVIIVFLLGIAYFTWNGVFTFLRTIACRNYDAAIALREDLMDIKLLYFSNN